MVIFSFLLIVIMIVRPQGILGHREFISFLTRKKRMPTVPPAPLEN
jgi:hypothetical protein